MRVLTSDEVEGLEGARLPDECCEPDGEHYNGTSTNDLLAMGYVTWHPSSVCACCEVLGLMPAGELALACHEAFLRSVGPVTFWRAFWVSYLTLLGLCLLMVGARVVSTGHRPSDPAFWIVLVGTSLTAALNAWVETRWRRSKGA